MSFGKPRLWNTQNKNYSGSRNLLPEFFTAATPSFLFVLAGEHTDCILRSRTAILSTTGNHRRLQKLEELTGSYPGVEKAFAIQAGREVRIMVKPEEVTEDNMIILARDIAKQIEAELEYPGQIKVNVIRETKAVEYAK